MDVPTTPPVLSDEVLARLERIRAHGPNHYLWTDHDVFTLLDEVKRLRAAESERAFLAPLERQGARHLVAAKWEAELRDLVEGLLATHRLYCRNGAPAVGLAFSEAASQLEDTIRRLVEPPPTGPEL